MPLVRVHPVTGRKWIAVNEFDVAYIKGVSRVVSQNILGILFDMIKSPEADRPRNMDPRGARRSGTTASSSTRASRITAWPADRPLHRDDDRVRCRRWVPDMHRA